MTLFHLSSKLYKTAIEIFPASAIWIRKCRNNVVFVLPKSAQHGHYNISSGASNTKEIPSILLEPISCVRSATYTVHAMQIEAGSVKTNDSIVIRLVSRGSAVIQGYKGVFYQLDMDCPVLKACRGYILKGYLL
jgi:hypothetical protein